LLNFAKMYINTYKIVTNFQSSFSFFRELSIWIYLGRSSTAKLWHPTNVVRSSSFNQRCLNLEQPHFNSRSSHVCLYYNCQCNFHVISCFKKPRSLPDIHYYFVYADFTLDVINKSLRYSCNPLEHQLKNVTWKMMFGTLF
jgi:hypothetical protein